MGGALERRQKILDILSIRRFEIVANLAAEFGVCMKSIYNDIAFLSLTHPIYTEQGKGGGVHYMDGCYSGRRYLTREQENFLKKLIAVVDINDVDMLNEIIDTFAMPLRKN